MHMSDFWGRLRLVWVRYRLVENSGGGDAIVVGCGVQLEAASVGGCMGQKARGL